MGNETCPHHVYDKREQLNKGHGQTSTSKGGSTAQIITSPAQQGHTRVKCQCTSDIHCGLYEASLQDPGDLHQPSHHYGGFDTTVHYGQTGLHYKYADSHPVPAVIILCQL